MNPTTSIIRQVNRDNPEVVAHHVSARFPVPAEVLFTYLTEEKHLEQWFGKVTRDEFLYEIEGTASGRIESCTDNSFLITWEKDGEVSFLNVEVTPDGAGSLLAAGYSTRTEDLREDFTNRYGSGATAVGWDLTLWALDRYIAGVTGEPPRDAYAEFVAHSARGWANADAAAGTIPGDPETIADNTYRFYLGLDDGYEKREK